MKITLPDGSVKEFDGPVSGGDVASSIGPRLAKAAIAAKVDGELTDLDRSIEADASVAIVTAKDDDVDALYVIRHSAAHVMAEAIQRIWPDAQLVYGPPVDMGFYYDIDLDDPISTDDFVRIEKEMAEIIASDRPFCRLELGSDEGRARLRDEGNVYKIDNAERALDGDGDASLSWYVTGEAGRDWEDLCRGPHVPSTGRIGAFKLTSVASSHWHGDVNQQRLQRVYGTAFATQKALDEHLERLEEARQRDHRVIGAKLGLFAIDEQVGQGLILWKPNGAFVRMQLEDFLKAKLLAAGYEIVYTPHIGKVDLYKTSGHYPYYSDSQFPPIKMHDDETEYILKPMNCPHHVKIYASEPRSYRDLPLRLAEFGTVYRFEQSGELTGMTRVRGFTQDDAHLFCTEDQVRKEFSDTVSLTQFVFNTFGFEDVQVRLSLREPGSDKYVGDPANWDRAERELREVLDEMQIDYETDLGEAAFYGPKVDFVVRDVIGRSWQLGTVQLDYNLPERFRLEYIGSDNQAHRPVMIHRAPFGSMERFMAILIEHYAGAFPMWLAPEQVRILPVSDKFMDYAEAVHAALRGSGIRAEVDQSAERVQAKIRAAQEMKVPYMLVVGGRDRDGGTVSVRCRTRADLGALPLEAFIEQAKREDQSHGEDRISV
ncbi:MAG: threonine--tRNA ligase [Planctomycetaceae bacterium]|nr:threonine--tRNA ligase [Planctomycetaceae bacterium]